MPRRLTAAQKAVRDNEIVADRNRGLTWAEVARRNGIEERQCRNVYREWVESRTGAVVGRDPLEVVAELIERYDQI